MDTRNLLENPEKDSENKLLVRDDQKGDGAALSNDSQSCYIRQDPYPRGRIEQP